MEALGQGCVESFSVLDCRGSARKINFPFPGNELLPREHTPICPQTECIQPRTLCRTGDAGWLRDGNAPKDSQTAAVTVKHNMSSKLSWFSTHTACGSTALPGESLPGTGAALCFLIVFGYCIVWMLSIIVEASSLKRPLETGMLSEFLSNPYTGLSERWYHGQNS